MNQRQRDVIDYLREENLVLREQFGERRLRFTDDQRRRLAVRGKKLSRKVLTEIVTLVKASNVTDLAPQAHCPEVRWQRKP